MTRPHKPNRFAPLPPDVEHLSPADRADLEFSDYGRAGSGRAGSGRAALAAWLVVVAITAAIGFAGWHGLGSVL